MAVEIVLPRSSPTMAEGVLIRWLKEDGDEVSQYEPIAEVETDKVIQFLEAPVDGVLRAPLPASTSPLPVGTLVGWVAEPGEELNEELSLVGTCPSGRESDDQATDAVTQPSTDLKESQLVSSEPEAPEGPTRCRVKASPVARRLAEKEGLDISTVTGTGPRGRVVREDVERAIRTASERAQSDEPTVARTMPLRGARKITAERMAHSAHTTAPVTLDTEADATEFVRWRTHANSMQPTQIDFRVSYNDLLIFVAARVLRGHPDMNARLRNDTIECLAEVNIGLAIDTEHGLLVPVVKHADRLDLYKIVEQRHRLTELARNRTLTPADVAGGTFTITNLGMFDIDRFTPIINGSQTAILGVGRIREKPVAWRGQVVVRDTVGLSLTFDHRIVDGADAARFLQAIKDYVEAPILVLREWDGGT